MRTTRTRRKFLENVKQLSLQFYILFILLSDFICCFFIVASNNFVQFSQIVTNLPKMSLNQEISFLSEQIDELTNLETLAKLSTVKTFLNKEIDRLKNRKQQVEHDLENFKKQLNSAPLSSAPLTSRNLLGTVVVKNYMWDQTNDYVKIYIEVDKSQKIEDSEISLKFAPNSKRGFTCTFGKYRFTLSRVYKDLNEQKCTAKITKSNRLIITLYKSTSGNWPSLEEKASNLKNSLEGDKGVKDDPTAGMMKLMKTMYEEGDDEMKRTIAKTWYESQNKQPEIPQL